MLANGIAIFLTGQVSLPVTLLSNSYPVAVFVIQVPGLKGKSQKLYIVLGHNCFLPNPLQFIFHRPSYHPMPCGQKIEGAVKQEKTCDSV
jgi:hypothetical protein